MSSMSDKLTKSLDDLVAERAQAGKAKRQSEGRRGGRGRQDSGRGKFSRGTRSRAGKSRRNDARGARFQPYEKRERGRPSRGQASFVVRQSADYVPAGFVQPAPGNLPPIRTGFALAISNLDEKVSKIDLEELFQQVGPLKYVEMTGKGTAKVMFVRKQDAMSAIGLYHGRELDDRPLQIIPDASSLPLAMDPPMMAPQQPVFFRDEFPEEDSDEEEEIPRRRTRQPRDRDSRPRGRGQGKPRGRGRGGAGGGERKPSPPPVSKEDLDAEMDAYKSGPK